jgi:hypothetical protein
VEKRIKIEKNVVIIMFTNLIILGVGYSIPIALLSKNIFLNVKLATDSDVYKIALAISGLVFGGGLKEIFGYLLKARSKPNTELRKTHDALDKIFSSIVYTLQTITMALSVLAILDNKNWWIILFLVALVVVVFTNYFMAVSSQ